MSGNACRYLELQASEQTCASTQMDQFLISTFICAVLCHAIWCYNTDASRQTCDLYLVAPCSMKRFDHLAGLWDMLAVWRIESSATEERTAQSKGVHDRTV